MNYDCFIKTLTQHVQERISEGYSVEVKPVRKNNGVILDSMLIRRPGDLVYPNLHLNPLYERYLDGMTIDQAVDSILRTYHMAAPVLEMDPDLLVSREILCSQVVYRLVNRERNCRLLEGVPHKEVLDLALIYYVMLHTEEFGDGAIMVREELLKHYDMAVEEMDEAAKENTRRLLPSDFMSITELLREFGEKSGAQSYSELTLEEESCAVPLYVLTNKQRQFGAYYMTDTDVLGEIAGKLGADLYLLPSSVHECMVVPMDRWEEADSLSRMVREINSSQVSETEYLADTVYRFIAEENRLEIAA